MRPSTTWFSFLLLLASCASGDFPANTPQPGVWAAREAWAQRMERQRLRYAGTFEWEGHVVSFTLLVLVGYPEDPFRVIGLTDLGAPWFEASVERETVLVRDTRDGGERDLLEEHLVRDFFALFRQLRPEDATNVEIAGDAGFRYGGAQEDILVRTSHRPMSFWIGRSDVRSRGRLFAPIWPPSRVEIENEVASYRLVLERASFH